MAQLHLDSLSKKRTRKDVRIALENLPTLLDDIYEQAMRRIWSQDVDDVKLAENVLSWISYARRPLTVKELQYVLAMTPENAEIDEDDLIDEEFLVSICAGLITIDAESSIIRLIHYTTQEYFERIRGNKFPDAERAIVQTCIEYILLTGNPPFEVRDGRYYSLYASRITNWLQMVPFLGYAAQYWGIHAYGYRDNVIQKLTLKLLKQDSKVLIITQIQQFLENQHQVALSSIPVLCVAASFGLSAIVSLLLDTGSDVRAIEGRKDTSLHWAAVKGQKATCLLLIERGADINASGGEYGSTLQAASYYNHEVVVRLLLDTGADVNASGGRCGNAPQAASYKGHESVV
jgi:hypothetical protein